MHDTVAAHGHHQIALADVSSGHEVVGMPSRIPWPSGDEGLDGPSVVFHPTAHVRPRFAAASVAARGIHDHVDLSHVR